MSMALKMTEAFLDTKGFRYKADEENNVMRLGIGGLSMKGDVELVVFFDEDDTSIGIRSFDYCNFPEDKISKMYEVCSKMNQEYRWLKFYVNEQDHTVSLAIDAVIQLDSCGEEILELVMRLAGIADKAYPNFMKAIWQ